MNAPPLLALLHLPEDEENAAMLLYEFEAAHPGVRLITPHYRDEPWRADIAKGMVPGEGPRTSQVIGADWPSELLAMLEKMFAPKCVDCGMVDPPPERTCDGGVGGILRDHFVGDDVGCPHCGRLAEACARNPCQVMRGDPGG